MPFSHLSKELTQQVARERIESLELWLRRLFEDRMSETHGPNYFLQGVDLNGQHLVKSTIRQQVQDRRRTAPNRYSRDIDALVLDDLVDLICKPDLYNGLFRDALSEAFPEGCAEARTFLKRLIIVRNSLAHANPITTHQAEQAVCYSDDVVSSLRSYYAKNNMANEYNTPRLLKFSDNLGNQRQIEGTQQWLQFDTGRVLRPGETLVMDVEPDTSFADDEYVIKWQVANIPNPKEGSGRRFSLHIEQQHVAEKLILHVIVTSTKSWHKHGMHDAMHPIVYKVLPPIDQK
jgi:hypothetical protein